MSMHIRIKVSELKCWNRCFDQSFPLQPTKCAYKTGSTARKEFLKNKYCMFSINSVVAPVKLHDDFQFSHCLKRQVCPYSESGLLIKKNLCFFRHFWCEMMMFWISSVAMHSIKLGVCSPGMRVKLCGSWCHMDFSRATLIFEYSNN